MSLPGATKAPAAPTTDDYKAAGKKLTKAALANIGPGCLICGQEARDQVFHFLLHFSVRNQETISVLVCLGCSKQLTTFELVELIQSKITESKQTSCANH